jgi:hypothetical protein
MCCRRRVRADRLPARDGARAVRNWQRIVRTAHRVRRLQRLWGHLGLFLQTFPSSLRDRLRLLMPKHD